MYKNQCIDNSGDKYFIGKHDYFHLKVKVISKYVGRDTCIQIKSVLMILYKAIWDIYLDFNFQR